MARAVPYVAAGVVVLMMSVLPVKAVHWACTWAIFAASEMLAVLVDSVFPAPVVSP